MYANDLRKLIKDRNKEMQEVLDPMVDDFIEQFKEAIIAIYNKGYGYIFAGCNRVGIAIEDVELDNLTDIKFDASAWVLAGSEDLEESYEMMTYWDFINQPIDQLRKLELAGYSGFEIYDMRYLVTEFEKRGFKCYADGANGKLVVVFEI